MVRRALIGLGVCVGLALPVACGDDTSSSDGASPGSPGTRAVPSTTDAPAGAAAVAFDEIEFTTVDDTLRSGRAFGEGAVGVVLSHMGGASNQDDWAPFAEQLADRGYRVVTYNDPSWGAVVGATEYLHGEGVDRVIVGGASVGAMSSLKAAVERGSTVAGVMWLAGTLDRSQYQVEPAEVAAIACPMLLMSGDEDGFGAADDTRQLHDWAADSELVIVESDRHGTDILGEGGPPARALEQAMVGFVDRVAASDTTC